MLSNRESAVCNEHAATVRSSPLTAHLNTIVCRFDPEKWVHEQLVALQCDADIRSAAHTYDMAAPSKQKHLPSLSNSRLPYLPAGLDLMEFYEFAALLTCIACQGLCAKSGVCLIAIRLEYDQSGAFLYLTAGFMCRRFGLDGKFVEQNHPTWWQRIRHWISLQRFGRRKWWEHIYKNESSKATTLGNIAAGRY